MSNKKETIIFGHFKLRFFAVLTVIVVVVALAYVGYNYATPTYLSSSFSNLTNSSFNSTYTIIGNGAHNLSVEVTVLNGLHEPMSGVTVKAQANIGHTISCTTMNGTCFVDYVPPRTPNPEKATIFINVGSVQKNINLTVEPDYPAQLLVYENITNQSAYTNSEVTYTVKAIDALGNLAPNDTIVNFSYNGGGYLSATSCLIENGICNVTYHTPQNPSIINFEVISGSRFRQFSLNVISRLITTTLVNFGSGGFCIASSEPPYTYKSTYLNSGENVTWSLNQPLPVTSVFVLKGYAAFYNFTMMVQKANQQYVNFQNTCYTGFTGFNDSNAYCQSYLSNNFCGAEYCPYITLQNSIQNLNPITISVPSEANNSYVGGLNFNVPTPGNYYFVIFPLGEYSAYDASPGAPVTLPLSGNPFGGDICYTDSYVYNTTIYNK